MTETETSNQRSVGKPEGKTGVEIVFPPDQRVRIADTSTFPVRRIGRLEMTFPNKKVYSGTGTLIDDYHVLTAAHNLWGKELGGWATGVSFTPAQNGPNDAPYGTGWAKRLDVPEEYRTVAPPSPLLTPGGVVVDYTQYVYDFGLITLDRAFDGTEIGLFAFDDGALMADPVSIIGYPGDKPVGTMWGETGRLGSVAEEFLFYKIDTYKGQSGSSLLRSRQGAVYSAGVHVAGSQTLDTNFAVRLNQDNIDQILAWM